MTKRLKNNLMKTDFSRISVLATALMLACSCNSWKEAASTSEEMPPIFPDYTDVTVPANIAPLNFMVEDAGHIQALLSVDGGKEVKVCGKDGIIRIPLKKWKNLLSHAGGKKISVNVSVWNEDKPDGVSYRSFDINVAPDCMDGWIAYRLIEPGYEGWRQLGIYQRDVTNFDEFEIVTNHDAGRTCVNCHNFPAYSSESMMFHARGAAGGTILYDKGKVIKIDFKSIGLKKNTTYPSWHPEGRFIAFSANTTHQIFFTEGHQGVEVFDTASDLTIYDIETGEAITDPRFSTEDALESFPSWSPEGDYLYFVSYKAQTTPVVFTPDMQYSLLRVPFNCKTRTFGEKVDTLYNAPEQGGSVSYPRISADGKYLLYTLSDYGTFPIWHDEADLRMMDLTTMKDVDVSIWNDDATADSFHNWSSNGRWAVFGSRRVDGRYTRLMIAYMDKDGKPHKPFLLPQEDPRHNTWRLRSYNVPEFIKDKVSLPKEAEKIFCPEN